MRWHVWLSWEKYPEKGASSTKYCVAVARAAAKEKVSKAIKKVADSYSVPKEMLEGHSGHCYLNADQHEYDSDSHYVEKTMYDTSRRKIVLGKVVQWGVVGGVRF